MIGNLTRFISTLFKFTLLNWGLSIFLLFLMNGFSLPRSFLFIHGMCERYLLLGDAAQTSVHLFLLAVFALMSPFAYFASLIRAGRSLNVLASNSDSKAVWSNSKAVRQWSPE